MHQVLRKLRIFAEFDKWEENEFVSLLTTAVVDAKADLVREEDEPRRVVFLIDGFACRHKMLSSGRRQIVGFLLPGDCCDPGVSILEQRDHTITAMCPSIIASVSDAALEALEMRCRKLKHALTWSLLSEQSISHEWIRSLGARSALERMAHLFCELYHRLNAIGLVSRDGFDLPLTQTDLADVLGIFCGSCEPHGTGPAHAAARRARGASRHHPRS